MRYGYSGKKRILINGISREVFISLSNILPEDKFITEYCQDTQSFFASPSGIKPDLIFCGISSEKNSPESLEKFSENPATCDIPVIAVTDTASSGREFIFRAGACDYILLPVCASEVTVKVDLHLSLHEAKYRENLLISTINSMSDILFVLDENGVFIEYYQTSLSEDLYMPPEIFLGKSYREIMPPHVVILADNAMNELMMTGLSQQYEYSIEMHGRLRWFSSKISIRKNNSGNFSGVVAVIRDITDRKMVEDSLRKQKDFNEILIQNSPAFFVAISSTGKTILMNKSLLNALGYSMEEVADTDYMSTFVPPEDHPGLGRIFAEIIRERKNTVNINRIICRDGRILDVEWHGVPVFKGEDFDFLIGMGFDVTEKIKTGHSLRESESLLKGITNNIPGVAYRFFARKNGEVGFYYISERSKEILGLDNDRNTFLNRAAASISDEYRESFLASIDNAIKTLSKWDFECKFIKPSGEAIWLRGISEPSGSGDEIIFNGVIIDITERKNAERAMRLLNYSLDYTTEGIFWLDSNARIIYVNDAACRSLEYSREELTGMSIYEIDADLSPETWGPYLDEVRKSGSLTFETKHKTRNGKIFPVEITSNYILFEGQEGTFSFVRDISQRKRAEEQLRQAQKMETVGTLAGGLAHDFNNILSGITGPLSLINYKLDQNRNIKPEVLREYFRMMYDSSMRAADIIQQLLSLSRKNDYSFTAVDLKKSIYNVINICRNSFDKSIELKTEYTPVEASVLGDSTQIEQVLLNLCVNAGHAMTIMRGKNEKWGGTLSVSLEKITADPLFRMTHPEASENDFWLITVSDTGIGIDHNTLHRIFDPFYTTKEKGHGTGLGLSIVYTIIRQHHGFIDVYSEEETGSSFKIYLPVFNEKYSFQENRNDEKRIKYGEGTILVIDDEKAIRHIVKAFLEECGYKIIVSGNAKEGIEIFRYRYQEITAVFLDMSMPEFSGKDVYIMLKQIYPDVKVLLSSGFRQDNRVEELLVIGVNGFIQKPLTIEKLSEAMYRVIHSS